MLSYLFALKTWHVIHVYIFTSHLHDGGSKAFVLFAFGSCHFYHLTFSQNWWAFLWTGSESHQYRSVLVNYLMEPCMNRSPAVRGTCFRAFIWRNISCQSTNHKIMQNKHQKMQNINKDMWHVNFKMNKCKTTHNNERDTKDQNTRQKLNEERHSLIGL